MLAKLSMALLPSCKQHKHLPKPQLPKVQVESQDRFAADIHDKKGSPLGDLLRAAKKTPKTT